MSKLAFVSMTLVGAVPSGFTLYLLVQHFVDHGVPQATALGIAVWVTLAALFLVVISPFIVLIRYKAPARVAAPAASSAKSEAASSKKKAAADDEFGDAIPDDFDEEELAASQPEEESYEDDGGDFDYAEDDMDDFEEEEEEAPKPKAKAKKK